MDELINNQDRIRCILDHYPRTRDNDMLLYLKLVEWIDRDYDQNAMGTPFSIVLDNMAKYHLPSFESVGRTRRKLQEKNPDLRGSETVQALRARREEVYREYARKG